MTLITRIIGNERTFIAADSQINDLQGYPYIYKDNGKIVHKQKLFAFPGTKLVLGFSGTFDINSTGYHLINSCTQFFANYQGDNIDIINDLIIHFELLKLSEKIDGSSIIMISTNRNSKLENFTIKIQRNKINIIAKTENIELIHINSIFGYCKEKDIDLKSFLLNFNQEEIRACVDVNFDYGDNNKEDINNHPILIYTILCITAFEQNINLHSEFIDKLSDNDLLMFLSCFYNNIIRFKENRNVIRHEIRMLYSIGTLSHYAIIRNDELKLESFDSE